MPGNNQIKVARLVEAGKPLEVGNAPKPTPGPKDVLVKVAACGVVCVPRVQRRRFLTRSGPAPPLTRPLCLSLPSSLLLARSPNTSNVCQGSQKVPLPKLPAIFGLDVAGTIEAVGADVLNLKVGDRVYVNPHLTCGTCPQCRRGRKDYCTSGCLRGYFAMSKDGIKLLDQYPYGGLSEYVVSPDHKIAVLPPSIDLKLAARFGYIGTSFGALRKADLGPGKTVLINGVTGTLGVAAVAIALGFGAVRILGVGRNKERLAQVDQMSPGRVVTLSSEDDVDPAQWAKAQTNGVGVDAFIDCLGAGASAESTTELIKGAVKVGGKAVFVAGGAEGTISQTYWDVLMNDIAIIGSMWFTDAEVDELVALVAAGVIDLSALEHKTFALDRVQEALSFAADRPGGFVNVVVLPNGEDA
jgi:alcohol dehydrogenase